MQCMTASCVQSREHGVLIRAPAQARLSVAAGAPKAAAEALGALLAQTQRASPAADDPRRQTLMEIESQVCRVRAVRNMPARRDAR